MTYNPFTNEEQPQQKSEPQFEDWGESTPDRSYSGEPRQRLPLEDALTSIFWIIVKLIGIALGVVVLALIGIALVGLVVGAASAVLG